MLESIFPKQLNHESQGSSTAKWVFVIITAVTIVRSLIHMFAPDGGAQSIATIPLDSFTPQGASTVVLLFAIWGLSQLVIGIIYIVVLWRYQAMIPFMYLLIIVEYGMRIVLGVLKPIEATGTTPGAIGNFIILPVAVVMFVLSIRNR
jgi:hypothetical protein